MRRQRFLERCVIERQLCGELFGELRSQLRKHKRKRFRSLLERCCIERKRLCCFLERERRRRDGHLVR